MLCRCAGKLHLLKGIITPEGGTDLAAAGLVGADFDTIPFLMMNGDYRPMAFREGNYAAVAAMNASPTRKVGPRSWLVAKTRASRVNLTATRTWACWGQRPWRSSTSCSTGKPCGPGATVAAGLPQ
jgi:hypothetical protein